MMGLLSHTVSVHDNQESNLGLKEKIKAYFVHLQSNKVEKVVAKRFVSDYFEISLCLLQYLLQETSDIISQ